MKTRFLGYQISYAEGMKVMRQAMEDIELEGNQLLLLEHRDTITYTRQHGTQALLMPAEEITRRGIELVETDRGGDVTFHGTGQLVGYPVLKLPTNMGVVDYVRVLEDTLIEACAELGVQNAGRVEGKTGVWVGHEKLIAIGVGVSRGVTRHGFALNISTDLERFTECITPCGLRGFGVTSLEWLGVKVGFEDVCKVLSWHLPRIC